MRVSPDQILAVVDRLGPVQPLDVRRALGDGDSMLIGATLSSLVARGLLQISSTRRGGGPFYYNPTTPERLTQLEQYVNEKDARTLQTLKEKKVLREDEQEPLVRVGLQTMQDFSKQLTVDGVVYWRYFLVPEEEARSLIGPAPAPAPVAEEFAPEPNEPEIKQEEKKEEKPEKKPTPKAKKERQVELEGWQQEDALYRKVHDHVGHLSHAQLIKAETELTGIIEREFDHGSIKVFVYASTKKRILEREVTGALLEARGKGMPLLVLTTEKLTKKVQKTFEDIDNVYFERI